METRGIAEGMAVRGRDGKKLGKVMECDATGFVVEKGLFFPKDYRIRYEQVADVRDGEVFLDEAQLEEGAQQGEGKSAEAWGQPSDQSRAQPAAIQAGEAAPRAAIGESREEVRVPLASEELEAEKRERQAGEVRVHKEVVTENRQVSVPVTREEVHVERVPAQGAQPGDTAFQEGTVAVPVREEEVELRKRPVVTEEVRVSRTRRQEERRADAEVRHEEARIDEQGDVKRDASGDLPSDLPGRDIDEPER